jgi:hypothetical protein
VRKASGFEHESRAGRLPRRLMLCLAVGITAAVLGSCSAAPSGIADPVAAGTATTPGGTAGTDQDADLPSLPAYPTWDQRASRDAIDSARSALSLYARHDLTPRRWWAKLSPRLSPSAAAAYLGTDPANVPVRTVRGPGHIVAVPSTYLAIVQIATDVGPYQVLLSREGQGSRWLVERFTPPASAGA